MKLTENIDHNMLACIRGQGHIEGQGNFLGHSDIIHIHGYNFLIIPQTVMELIGNIHHNRWPVFEVKVLEEVKVTL